MVTPPPSDDPSGDIFLHGADGRCIRLKTPSSIFTNMRDIAQNVLVAANRSLEVPFPQQDVEIIHREIDRLLSEILSTSPEELLLSTLWAWMHCLLQKEKAWQEVLRAVLADLHQRTMSTSTFSKRTCAARELRHTTRSAIRSNNCSLAHLSLLAAMRS